ncbi:hypothetical protein MPSEU_000121900 [Mayamaea pseudoterrestris]|nr:hypothetical protein MPSEU_000121900 [Mayamaea pseudoterrestris]
MTKSPQQQQHDDDYNVFRHSLLRYAGYANEVGESFRYQFPRFVAPSYVVAFGYCIADAAHSGYNAYHHQQNKSHRMQHTARATMDTLVWQSLASVALPGMTINLIVKASRQAVQRTAKLPVFATTWLPTVIGLGAIPFIVHPIDRGVDYVMDETLRSWWKPKGNDDMSDEHEPTKK